MTSSRKGDAVVGFRDESTLLNTDDLKHALDIAVNLGHPPSDKSPNGTYRLFEVPFTCKRALWDNWLGHRQGDAFQNFTESERARAVRGLLVKALDMDGDGRITPKDLQLLYETRLTSTLTRHEDTLNKWLPLAGQCAFGGLMGLSVGAVARGAYKRKYRIAGIGFAVYTGAQYLAQQNFVNQRLLEKAFREKVRQLADVNGDGEVNREDINALVENRVKFVATKLGPGGLAPGMAGYASLALGFARGIRALLGCMCVADFFCSAVWGGKPRFVTSASQHVDFFHLSPFRVCALMHAIPSAHTSQR
ncbi:hypothetical protein LSCM1_03110 [Leishmania martiniquensis]|uniref:EF-hand domain-containing protein n=1 Tax=Leishmania martiniquensis TaxID=1580590 RepID=A0A836GYL7_9TRYP|nr:hypothetical protein LSCM1_03110 [Leishmania martiniquensis]